MVMEEVVKYQVTVRNVGIRYAGPHEGRALACFHEYVKQSTNGVGRVAFESVVLSLGDEILFELSGPGEDWRK